MRSEGLTKRGVVVARLTIDILIASAVFLDQDVFDVSARDILICLAVYIGHAEHRPMTAANIAEIVGIPRPTVIRRLASLRVGGFVEKLDSGRWIIADRGGRHTKTAAKIFAISAQHIHNAASELSKLDKVNIAPR